MYAKVEMKTWQNIQQKREANIKQKNKDGRTPLFNACSSGNKDLIEYLVEHKAEINNENKNGETPLFYALKSENKDLVEYLKKQGAV